MTKTVKRMLYAKEILFLALAICSIIFLAIDQFGHLSQEQLHNLYFYDVCVGILFIIEWFSELKLATNRRGYVRSNWYYLLAAIPLPYAIAQLLRGLRVIRAVKVVRFGIHYIYEQKK